MRSGVVPLAAATLCACTSSVTTAGTAGTAASTPLVDTRAFAVPSTECYSVSYSDPKGAGKESLFPKWVALYAGRDSGEAYGRDYPPVATYERWKRLGADSLRIDFTGPAEGVTIHAAREDSSLVGRAIWLSDVIGPPVASMRAFGSREPCPPQFHSAN